LTKLDKLQKELNAIGSEIQELEKFRETNPLKRFKRQLQGELSHIKEKIRQSTETPSEKVERAVERVSLANQNRSEKNKRIWRYVKAVQKNYRPDLSLKVIRTQLKKHRQGLENDIPDVAWRNPSP
jgi:uncharacterized coiled-coil DUF342 family protein